MWVRGGAIPFPPWLAKQSPLPMRSPGLRPRTVVESRNRSAAVPRPGRFLRAHDRRTATPATFADRDASVAPEITVHLSNQLVYTSERRKVSTISIAVIGGSVIDVPRQHERPPFRVLADELRRRINAGAIPPGSPLPSESRLQDEFGYSRHIVRAAIRLLREEGLIITEHGRASYVRPQLPVRRIGSERYRRELDIVFGRIETPETSFTADQGIAWSEYRLDREFREVPATTAIAELFDVAPGTMLLERQFTFWSSGVPQQMSVSYYPLDMVAGTPVADPANEPWPGGNIAQLYSLGIVPTRIHERVRGRMPLPEEADTLRIASGVPVLVITRQTYAGARVVEAAVDIVIPADRVELDYWIDLTEPGGTGGTEGAAERPSSNG